MDRDVRFELRVRKGVEPAVRYQRVPWRQEGFPERRATDQGGRGAGDDNAGSGHP